MIVLVAMCFNKCYDLQLTTRGLMEIAYAGELLTPSRCGRMDQGIASVFVTWICVFFIVLIRLCVWVSYSHDV
jgi:galactokinase